MPTEKTSEQSSSKSSARMSCGRLLRNMKNILDSKGKASCGQGRFFSWRLFSPALSLRGARLDGANFRGAYLEGIDLSSAILGETDLREAYFQNADFTQAVLRHSRFGRADFSGANLANVVAFYCHGKGVKFHESRIEGSDFDNFKIDKLHVRECGLKGDRLI